MSLKRLYLFLLLDRLLLGFIGILSRKALEPFTGNYYVWKYTDRIFLDIWGVWDTGWYINIADGGYRGDISLATYDLVQLNYAFFPLYPYLMRIAGWFAGGSFYGGLIISNVSLVLLVFVLFRLVEKEYGQDTAFWSVAFLIGFPTSFILSSVYSESLFLLLVALSFYFVSEKKWFLASVFGFLVSLTRLVGFFVLIPVFVAYLRAIDFQIKNAKREFLYIFLIPAGLLLFSYLNFKMTGDFLAFIHAQKSWERTISNPLAVLVGSFGSSPEIAFQGVFAGVFILLLVISHRKLKFSYWLYSVVLLLLPLFSKVDSMPRYILGTLPVFFMLPLVFRSGFSRLVVFGLFLILQGFLMVSWSNGLRFVF